MKKTIWSTIALSLLPIIAVVVGAKNHRIIRRPVSSSSPSWNANNNNSPSSHVRTCHQLAFQAFNPPTFVSNGAAPWLLQLAAGVSTYIACVAISDRPQGQLFVRENEQIQVKPSLVPGAGLGLFAKTNLPKGLALGTYPGVIVPPQANRNKLQQYPQCEYFVWRFSDNQYVIDPTNAQGILEDYCVGGTLGQFLSIWLFQTILKPFWKVPTTLCRINEPPKGMDVNVVTEENRQDRTVTFLLERNVMAGEEFFIDYGLTYDRSMYSREG
jgi:hypothetical protein